MPIMVSVSAYARAFGLGASLGLAACGEKVPDTPLPLDAMDIRPVSSVLTPEGFHKCNFTVIGSNLVFTNFHCADEFNERFFVLDKGGMHVEAGYGNAVMPHSEWIEQRDREAGEDILGDKYYRRIAEDRAIVLLTENLGDISGTYSLAPLDSLTWTPVEDHPDFSTADVKIITHWPSRTIVAPPTAYKTDCQLVRLNNVREVVAHTCPERKGVSGSPLAIETGHGGYAIAAIVQGKAVRDYDTPLVKAFARVIKTPTINFAATADSMSDLCEQLDNCRAARDEHGYAVLALTR